MTDTDSTPAETETDVQTDEAREALFAALTDELGTAVVGHHVMPGVDCWVRVTPEAWGEAASYLHDRQRFRFFSFLSAIDWMPSPYGRSKDASVDRLIDGKALGATDEEEEVTPGYAGTDSRFQVFARVYNLTTRLGVTIRADVPEDSMTVPTWTHEYPGADWHEREAFEMFGLHFAGHPGLRKLYLPGDFEGHPLRKDFPLLARIVKPWPGIVDVEPMPESDDTPSASTTNTEAGDESPSEDSQ